MAPPDPGGPDLGRYLAALTALGLGVLAAVMMIAGHPPWQGPVWFSVTATHGIHEGDALAVLPFAVGLALSVWCLRRRAPA